MLNIIVSQRGFFKSVKEKGEKIFGEANFYEISNILLCIVALTLLIALFKLPFFILFFCLSLIILTNILLIYKDSCKILKSCIISLKVSEVKAKKQRQLKKIFHFFRFRKRDPVI